ncbi:MAG: hypothetical protein K5866_10265 [Treponema sp.]|nr:hypothetical protein [Treponema sp.]
MKTLKKIATVLAVMLGLGFVLSTTSCGIANVTIDADFIANEDFSSFVGTWVGTVETNDAENTDGLSIGEGEYEIATADEAKALITSLYTTSELAKTYATSVGKSFEYTLATNTFRTIIVWDAKSGEDYITITLKKK